MTKLFALSHSCFLLLFLFGASLHSSAHAEIPFSKSNWQGPDPLKLAAKIQSMGKKNPGRLGLITNQWRQKCNGGDQDQCLLTEKDVYPEGSADKFLLFRGENTLYSLPAVSTVVRDALSGSYDCQETCSYEYLLTRLNDLIGQVLLLDIFRGRGFLPLVFVDKIHEWHTFSKCTDSDGKTSCAIGDSPGLAMTQRPGNNAIFLFSTTHIDGGLQVKNTNGDFNAIDPFVSFSASPEVALSFISQGDKKTGRLIVLSVLKSRIPTGDNCGSSQLFKAGSLMDVSTCVAYETYNQEIEYDVVFAPDEHDIKDVLLVPTQAKNSQ